MRRGSCSTAQLGSECASRGDSGPKWPGARGNDRLPVFDAAQDVHDVATDRVEVVAALLNEHGREGERPDGAPDPSEVVGDELKRVVVFGRGIDAERHNE